MNKSRNSTNKSICACCYKTTWHKYISPRILFVLITFTGYPVPTDNIPVFHISICKIKETIGSPNFRNACRISPTQQVRISMESRFPILPEKYFCSYRSGIRFYNHCRHNFPIGISIDRIG